MNSLVIHHSDGRLDYSGSELRPHFLLERYGLKGNAVLAIEGACDVSTANLVDWEDRLAKDFIRAERMVHFLGEFFGPTLREGVLLQRLFMSIIAEVLSQQVDVKIIRDGDDLFVNSRKLSVSIVTSSPVSQLLHIGINVDSKGAPVAAIGTSDLGLKMSDWPAMVLKRFAEEWESIGWACAKVRPVM